MQVWNPWHGCHKISAGCQNCYVYRRDAEFGKDASQVMKTNSFQLPIKKDRKGNYKLTDDGDMIFTCGTSDFFLEEADAWREEAWSMMKARPDLHFLIITKRIHRFLSCIPADWGEGYENVTIGCTCENQNRTDYRLPIFFSVPIRHRMIIHEPMLEAISIRNYLKDYGFMVDGVLCGGESGDQARVMDYAWVLDTMLQCVEYDVSFHFKQTGANFKHGDRIYQIERGDQITQARKANIDYTSQKNAKR